MPGGIGIEWDLGAMRREDQQKKQKREEDSQKLFQNLLDQGYQTDVAQEAAQNLLKTGEVNIPQYQTNKLPPSNLFPEGIPARGPAIKQDRTAVYTLDQSTGEMKEHPLAPDVKKAQIEPIYSNAGQDIYVNAQTGAEIKREPNGTKSNKIIKVGSAGGGGGAGKERPDITLAKKELMDIQKDIDAGIPVDPDRMAAAKSAASIVPNVDVGQEPDTVETTQPGMIGKFFGEQPTTVTTPGKPFVRYGANNNIPTPQGKPMTPDLAKKFLAQYGGDKEKARAAAVAAGYDPTRRQ